MMLETLVMFCHYAIGCYCYYYIASYYPPPPHSTRISLFLCPQARTINEPTYFSFWQHVLSTMTQELRWNSWHSSDTPVFWTHVSAISCLRLEFFAPLFYCWRHAKIYFTKLQFLLSCPTVQPGFTEYKQTLQQLIIIINISQ